ncbi:MAG: DUF429 domain-containing protein, partial [Actinomycetota bacterium]|nr:DUF429 domain-containing protein [Actinomycetota bacterium]
MSVVGIDGCRGGWIAIVLRPPNAPAAVYVETLDRIVDEVPDAEAFGIDIPIGLPTHGRRQADTEARSFLGPRRASVFFAPVREALVAPDHAEATRRSKLLTGQGVSRQAYALGPKILEVEHWSRQVSTPVWEVHPEVSFAVMLGHPARAPKKTGAGVLERLRALDREGIPLEELGEAAERAAIDDVLDAEAAAWSADRLLRGQGMSLPDPPELDPETG